MCMACIVAQLIELMNSQADEIPSTARCWKMTCTTYKAFHPTMLLAQSSGRYSLAAVLLLAPLSTALGHHRQAIAAGFRQVFFFLKTLVRQVSPGLSSCMEGSSLHIFGFRPPVASFLARRLMLRSSQKKGTMCEQKHLRFSAIHLGSFVPYRLQSSSYIRSTGL